MASQKPTSKKRSASSKDSPPDAAPLLFIDRCAWSRRLDAALKSAGIPHIAHREKFADNCPDEEWMNAAGRAGWIVITRDQAIRRKPNELKAFRDAKLIMFALASGNASAEDTARLVVALYPKILRKALAAKAPAMFSVTLAGGISPVR
jgi:predicted nuclease of predicted toxin-antitoxin system